MNFEDRLRRRRDLALLEAQGLVSLHRIELEVLVDLELQIEERRHSLVEPIAAVRSMMAEFRLSLEDVLDGVAIDPRPITHQHPRTAESWDGQGPQPEWLRRALLVEGYRPSDLRIGSSLDVAVAK